MKHGTFCAQAPVQIKLGLFLLKATCEWFVALRQSWQASPSHAAQCGADKAWLGQAWVIQFASSGPKGAWAGRGSPPAVWGQAVPGSGQLSCIRDCRTKLSSTRLEEPGLCQRTRGAQMPGIPRALEPPTRAVVRLWEEQGCRVLLPSPSGSG